MKIHIYADGSNLEEMISLYKNNKLVCGFTTNPSLMKKAGIKNYSEFARRVTETIKDVPISFEVFADELPEMERQAKVIAGFGSNVYVKIPVTNTKGESTKQVIKNLLDSGIPVNVTAVFTRKQIKELKSFLKSSTPVILSIFAGRIADTGIDPKPIMKHAIKTMPENVKVLWASPREVFNVYEADQINCHIITITSDLLAKLSLKNKDLTEYSLDTVKMFYNDAASSNYTL